MRTMITPRRLAIAAFGLVAIVGLARSAHADNVGVSATSASALASPGNGAAETDNYTSFDPTSGSGSINVMSGGTAATTNYAANGGSSFQYSANLTLDGTAQGQGAGSQANVSITPTENLTYTFLATFTLKSGAPLFFATSYFDLSNQSPTPYADLVDTFVASGVTDSGSLTAGETYSFTLFPEIYSSNITDQASAYDVSYSLSFAPSDATAAPLPSTAFAGMGLLGCVGILTLARRRKPAAP